MKVILLKDVPKIGRKFDVRMVSDGYAHNFLLPMKLAALATAEIEKSVARDRALSEGQQRAQEEDQIKNLRELDGKTVALISRANKRGILFASINADEIALAIEDNLGFEISPEMIMLERPIKETGVHAVNAVHKNLKATFIVEIKPEE